MTVTQLLDQIHTEARDLKPGRVALTLAAAPFFAIGWLVGSLVRLCWWAFAWCWSCVVVGYQMSRAKKQG